MSLVSIASSAPSSARSFALSLGTPHVTTTFLRLSFPRRDDPDCFLVFFFAAGVTDDEECSAENLLRQLEADPVLALVAFRFVKSILNQAGRRSCGPRCVWGVYGR